MTPLTVGTCYVGSRNQRTTLIPNLQSLLSEGHVLLGGDFNAKTGSLEPPACVLQREQADTTCNQYGKVHVVTQHQPCSAQAGLQMIMLGAVGTALIMFWCRLQSWAISNLALSGKMIEPEGGLLAVVLPYDTAAVRLPAPEKEPCRPRVWESARTARLALPS